MRFGLDSLSYLLSCVLSTTCLAACSNSLVQRNQAVGEQSRAAMATGITLILKTTDLSSAGYALSVGSGGVAVGTLILFLYSLELSPVPAFSRKIFFLSPLMLLLNNILILAAGIAVTYIARHGTTSAAAYLGTARIPDAVLQAQIAKAGLPLDYWSNGYVKFMVASAWPQMIPNLFSLFFAYKAYQVEKPSAYRQRSSMHDSNAMDTREVPHYDDKAEVEHIA